MKYLLCLLLTCLTSLGAGYRIRDLPPTNGISGPEMLELDDGTKSWRITSLGLVQSMMTNNDLAFYSTNFITMYQLMATNCTFVSVNAETNINNYSYVTNLYSSTNINNYSFVTNLYVVTNYVVTMYVSTNYTTNLFSETNFNSYTFITNQVIAKTAYITNLYVENPFFGLQQLTNVAITNPASSESLTWNSGMKKWTNAPLSTTVILTNIGVMLTNVFYTSNMVVDLSYYWNDYQTTNVCTNHINIYMTNLTPGVSASLSILGASSYTNFNVFFTWPAYATVTWLSLTNGLPVTTITSNKLQFYSFLIRTNQTQTNVIASFKEQP